MAKWLFLLCVVSCHIGSPRLDASHNVYSEENAKSFIKSSEARLAEAELFWSHASWLAATNIGIDSQFLEAKAFKDATIIAMEAASQVKHWDGVDVSDETRWKLNLLRSNLVLPAPKDETLAQELANISSKMQALYGEGKYCDAGGECYSLADMSAVLAAGESPELMKEFWLGWRTVSPPMRRLYARQVDIVNAGAKELGFDHLSQMWRSKYNMTADAFAEDIDLQWAKVKPLYEALHCHVRAKLNQRYGDEVVPINGKIPAHLLGNMWAQTWGNIFDLVKPDVSPRPYDLTQIIKEKQLSEVDMVRIGEAFFSSLGFAPLPETFWQRSLFLKPKDREVVCHASAWNIDGVDDLRIKMCIQKNWEDFYTIHHELGHNYYQRAYNHQSYLYRASANDGFHEALGDTISLSITPTYLKQIGLLQSLPPESTDLGFLMEQALEKIAFLPFGLLVDKWRWQVFEGTVNEADYNRAWWDLREEYQGITAPVPRTERDFDPGAKYHIPGNTPYARYFLAYIQQFQFHKALCDASGFEGPLHRCSIYGSRRAGEKLQAMMAMGASQPWQEAMRVLTGQGELDASALVEYFAPIKEWLDEQNKQRQCGW